MDEPSTDIIQLAAKGDIDAFGEIYRAFSRLVYNVIFRIVGSKEDAEELTQEVFVSIFQKLGQFQFKSSIKTWVYRVAVNTALTGKQKQNREKEKVMELGSAKRVQDQSIKSEITMESISDLLNVLPQDQRICLILRSMEGLSYQEISDTLQLNLNTVRTRLKRARETLIGIRGRN